MQDRMYKVKLIVLSLTWVWLKLNIQRKTESGHESREKGPFWSKTETEPETQAEPEAEARGAPQTKPTQTKPTQTKPTQTKRSTAKGWEKSSNKGKKEQNKN